MNTHRKFFIFLLTLTCAISTEVQSMHSEQQLALSNTIERDGLLLLTGFAIGSGCVSAYCYFTHYQEQLHSFEKRVQKLEEETKNQKDNIKEIKQLQKEEEKRLNQGRQWVMDEKNTRQENFIRIMGHLDAQKKEFSNLTESFNCLYARVEELEDGTFHSAESFSE